MNVKAAMEILGLPSGGVTLKQLTSAFRKKAIETHPDKGGDAQEFIKVKLAFDFIVKRGPDIPAGGVDFRHPQAQSAVDFRVHWDCGIRVNCA